MSKAKLFPTIMFVFAALLTIRSQAQTTYHKLKEVAIKINKSMPQILDEYTQVDSLRAIPPDTLQYYATLLHVNKSQESLTRIKQIMQAKMLNTIKTQQEFKPYRDNKVKIVYKYYDESRVFLFAIFLTPDKYLN